MTVAAGAHLVLVDMYDPFVANANYKDEYFVGAGVHPATPGFKVMAEVWWQAIGGLLPKR